MSKFHRQSASGPARVREIATGGPAAVADGEQAAAALKLLLEDGMDRDRAVALLEAAGRSGFDLGVVVRTALKLRESGW